MSLNFLRNYSLVFPTGQHMYTSIRNGCATISVSIGETSLQRSLRGMQDPFYFFQILHLLFIPVNEQRWAIKLLLKVRKSQIHVLSSATFSKGPHIWQILKVRKFSDFQFAERICGPPTLIIKWQTLKNAFFFFCNLYDQESEKFCVFINCIW